MGSNVATGEAIRASIPVVLFRAPFEEADLAHISYPYDVSPDGKRILVNKILDKSQPPEITMVVSWPEIYQKQSYRR
jgi:hypothetical protein